MGILSCTAWYRLAAVRRTALFCEPPLNGVHVSEMLTPPIGDHVSPVCVWQVASRAIFQHKYFKDKDLPARQPEEKSGESRVDRSRNSAYRRKTPEKSTIIPSPHHQTAACLIWQFLYFLPLPQGQGSLRPTRSPRLRIGSSFLSLAWLVETWSPFALMVGRGADSWTAAPMAHTDS